MGIYNPHTEIGIIHFVGIGGIGMSGIAEVLHHLGHKVQGSDANINSNTIRLDKLGIKIFHGHNKNNILNADYLVISSAINNDNEEVKYAIKNHIPIIKRSEMLAELMRFKNSIAVSGSHGKTTTTSLIANMLEVSGHYPTVINGGIISNKATNAYVGHGNFLVAETDESDGTFNAVPSNVAVITNIDKEHIGYYGSFENLKKAFKKFITNLPFYGFAVACIDCMNVNEVISEITSRNIITYGVNNEKADINAINIRYDQFNSYFDIRIKTGCISGFSMINNVHLPIPGHHNVTNAVATIAIGYHLGLSNKILLNAFNGFKGVKRRFTNIGSYKNAIFIDDYAHHPCEIKATLKTAKIIAKSNKARVISFFQPHRYSRLKNLYKEFTESFNESDFVYICNIYSAGEEHLEGITNISLAKDIKSVENQKISYANDLNQIKEIIRDISKANDIILFMGAGDISNMAEIILNDLQKDK